LSTKCRSYNNSIYISEGIQPKCVIPHIGNPMTWNDAFLFCAKLADAKEQSRLAVIPDLSTFGSVITAMTQKGAKLVGDYWIGMALFPSSY
jgi:hypothetical protein